MRARHRHFNARDAGAALCLDARFISGLSDGNAVSTWSDRSRNAADAVQSTAANQPEYKTAIQGGQPVVRFSGSADANGDFFPMTTPLATVFKNKGYGLVLAVNKDTNPTGGAEQHTVFYNSNGTSGASTRCILRTRDLGGNRFQSVSRRQDGDSASFATATPSDSDWHILASEQEWTNNINRLRIDYTSRVTSTFSSGGGSTSNTDSLNVEIGSGNNGPGINAAPIDLGQLVVLNEASTEAIVKRLHHHAAFSFKISCN
jgi:hypothetical protein